MKYNDIEIVKIPVESSNISSLGYHDEFQIMSIEMLDGHIYYYLDIPKIHFDNMIQNNKEKTDISSIGSYLHRNIKGNFRYIKIK